MKVVDSSVLFDALVDEGRDGERSRVAIAESEFLVAPELIDLEVISATRRGASKGEITPALAEQAVDNLRFFPIKRESHELLLVRAWDLRENITPYDAVYIALAEILEIPLLTRDARLARAPGVECEFQLLD